MAADQRERANGELESATALADRAGIARRVAILTDQLLGRALQAETWNSLLRDLTDDWRDVLHRHRELLRESRRASERAEQARAEERAAAAKLERTLARRAACEQQLDEARSVLSVAFRQWRGALVELDVDNELATAAMGLAHEGKPATPALSAPADRVRGSLADERSAASSAREIAVEAVHTAEAEIERLAAARDDGPVAPAWSRADRGNREGAPFWRLVDFENSVSDSQRAGLEAAFEAAGLLDAWVTPTGGLADPALADVVLSDGGGAAGAGLRDVLKPVPDQSVEPQVVARLLESIGLGEHDSGPWVSGDGRFVMGPLSGRGAKAQAEHIGAAAREARRAALIDELRTRIGVLETEVGGYDAQLNELDRRRARLERELADFPTVDAVTSAIDAVKVVAALEADAARAHEHAAAVAHEAADAEIAADAARREHAATHDLPARTDDHALEGLRDATAQLSGAAGAVANAWKLAEREAQAVTTVGERLSDAQRAGSELDLHARDEEAESDRLTAEHATREAALGATGEELRRRHETVTTELRSARDTLRRAGEQAQKASIAAAKLESDVDVARPAMRTRALGARTRASRSVSSPRLGS